MLPGHSIRFLVPVQAYLKLLTSHDKSMSFEHVVLEQSLSNVTNKFQRHIELTKPALDTLLQQITQDPSTSMLRRLLAFRFINNVTSKDNGNERT